MATGAFARLAKSVLRHHGKDAFLHSGVTVTPCRVAVEHGVQVTGEYGDAVFERDVATLDLSVVQPRSGDTLVHPDGTYKLDGKLQDTAYTTRYTLQPGVAP
jgi:hypothetical protein